MGQSYFSWNGIDCRSMGILMDSAAPIIRPEERVKHIQIPGVSGDLTETEGENVYNSYIQTVTMHMRGGLRVREVYKWLRGSGFVTFSGEPDRKQQARIIGAITLAKHSRNLDWWSGEVQFYCQPLKEKLREAAVTISESGATVRNEGDVNCRPLYKVTARGASVAITVAGDGLPQDNSITVTGLSNGTVIWIDCETMEVWNAARSALLTKNSTGDFPVMAPGVNTITGIGWSAIEITKRERFL